MTQRARVRRTRNGRYQLRLPSGERDLLRSLPGQVLELIASDDPGVQRLFPPAYQEDPHAEAEYRSMMQEQLLEHHRKSLEVLAETVDADVLDEEQLQAWLGALNDLRLVIGTRLDITEETRSPPPDDPRAASFAVYDYLTWLQGTVVDLIASTG